MAALSPEERLAQGIDSLPRQLSTLVSFRRGPDPTLRLEIEASVPTSPAGPGLLISVLAGALIGFVIGLAAAFGTRALDPRLRREEQIREHYRLPIFARIPKQREFVRSTRATAGSLTAVAQEAYRSLRTLLVSRAGSDAPQVLVITSPSAGDGKSTTALNLALSFASGGRSVLLLEADLPRPSLARALSTSRSGAGRLSTLLGKASLDDALHTVDAFGPIRLVPACESEPAAGSRSSRSRGLKMISLPKPGGVLT